MGSRNPNWDAQHQMETLKQTDLQNQKANGMILTKPNNKKKKKEQNKVLKQASSAPQINPVQDAFPRAQRYNRLNNS